jgi:hypothetical protein
MSERTRDELASVLCVGIWALFAWLSSAITGWPWVNLFSIGTAYALFKNRMQSYSERGG